LTACRCSADIFCQHAAFACWTAFLIFRNHQLQEYFLVSLISNTVTFMSCCMKLMR
jgi:hypothetical protein